MSKWIRRTMIAQSSLGPMPHANRGRRDCNLAMRSIYSLALAGLATIAFSNPARAGIFDELKRFGGQDAPSVAAPASYDNGLCDITGHCAPGEDPGMARVVVGTPEQKALSDARHAASAQTPPPASPAQTPLTGAELGYWRSNIWVTGQFGNYFDDSNSGVYSGKAIEGKMGGAYHVFASYPLGDDRGGKAGVVLYETSCDFSQLIDEKCSDKDLVTFQTSDDGVLTGATARCGECGKNMPVELNADFQERFLKVRDMWVTNFKALYASTMTQEQLDKIFGAGVVHPLPQ